MGRTYQLRKRQVYNGGTGEAFKHTHSLGNRVLYPYRGSCYFPDLGNGPP